MIRYRYSRWDSLQEAPPFEVDQLMDQLTDRLMEEGDLDTLLKRLCQRGMTDQEGNRIQGLQELWRDLRKKRQELLEKYPPSQRTLQETLREVKRCTAARIVINTFMLARDRFLERFVDQLARANRGRAFFTTPDRIGEYVVVDYLSRKRRKIA